MEDVEESAEDLSAEQAHEEMLFEDIEKEKLYTTEHGDIKVIPAKRSYKIPKTNRLV